MKYILPLKKIDREDKELVGEKAAELGELKQAKINVPDGFVITTAAHHKFMEDTGIKEKFNKLVSGISGNDLAKLEEAGNLVRRAIVGAPFPQEIEEEVRQSYKELGKGKKVQVTVRSSVVLEQGSNLRESFLDISGAAELTSAIKKVWASQFDSGAWYEVAAKKVNPLKVGIAVPVQLMVEAEASGTAFSVDPITNDKTKVVVESVFGLGSLLEYGAVSPDYFEFEKGSLGLTYSQIGAQDRQEVYVDGKVKQIPVSKAYMSQQKAPDNVMREVAKQARELERHFGRPQEVEWAWDGKKVYVLESVAATAVVHKAKEIPRVNLPLTLKGAPGSAGISSGKARVVRTKKDLEKVIKGEIVVAGAINAEAAPLMKGVAGIVTDQGGATSHVTVLARQMGVPVVVGALEATKKLKEGYVYTINGSSGEVFEGRLAGRSTTLPYEERQQLPAKNDVKTATKIMVNLEDPAMAVVVAAENVDGIGLLRAERMMREIGVHPKAAIKNKKDREYVERLTEGIAEFCKAFGDRPVIYRAADFMSNEYRELGGGSEYEIYELNPMLGYRGAARHIKEPEVFGLELEAIKKVRNVHGYKNLHLLAPFVRTPKELADIKMLVSSAGLHRGVNFRIYMMARAPSTVLRLGDFAKVGIDGISVDVNDLAQLVLAIDRSSGRVDEDMQQIDDSVLWCMERIGQGGREYGMAVGASGDEALDPGLAEKLVGWGYSYISVSPEAVGKVRGRVAEAEKKLVSKKSKEK